MNVEQATIFGLANQWFWIGLITGIGIGIFFSALMRLITDWRG
jgi:hypothetical protein